MSQQRWAILSIGSNMGDTMDNCKKGIQAIAASDGIAIEKISPLLLDRTRRLHCPAMVPQRSTENSHFLSTD